MQKILDYRVQLEEEAKVRLAEAQRNLQVARHHMEVLRRELRGTLDRISALPPENINERWLTECYARGLQVDAAQGAVQVTMLTQIVEDARKLLTARAVDRKMLEKLKERQRIRHDHDERLKEQRINDETATLRYKAPAF
jgi:flagellar FliJ protein